MNNTALSIRNKLFDYIRVADNKKLNAIYNLLEDEIEQTNEWGKDKQTIKELGNRFQALENGADKGYTISELQKSIEKLHIKKYGK